MIEVTWARFVVAMKKRGITTLLQELNTYTNKELPMLVYAELNNQLVGVYHPTKEQAVIFTKPSNNWSKRERKFNKIKI